MNNLPLKKVIWLTTGLAAAALLVGGVWYAATHGIMVITNSEGVRYTLDRSGVTTQQVSEGSGSWALVKSGAYQLTLTTQAGQSVQQITVPSFLRSLSVSMPQITPQKIERVAAGTLGSIGLRADGEVLSANIRQQSNMLLVHPASDPTGLNADTVRIPTYTPPAITQNNRLIALAIDPATNMDVFPAVFDFASGTTTQTKKSYIVSDNVDSSPTPVAASTANTNFFGIYYEEKGTKPMFDVYDNTTLVRTFDNLSGAANAGSTRAVALSQKVVAIGYGDDYVLPQGDDGGPPPATKEYVVKLFDIASGREFRSVNIGKTNGVAGIGVSRDGSYITVSENNSVKVYDSASSTLVFSYASASDMVWRDDTRLLFRAGEKSIFILDTKTRAASSLFLGKRLTLNSFSVYRDQLLFTGYRGERPSGDTPPDGFILSLSQPSPDNNALIENLPYTDSKIKLTSMRGVVYAARNSGSVSKRDPSGNFLGPEFRPLAAEDASLRADVNNYLSKNFANYRSYRVVLGENL